MTAPTTQTATEEERQFLRRARRLWRRPDEPPRRQDNSIVGHSRATPYLFSLPAIVLVALILAFPVLYGVWQSLYPRDSLADPAEYVGLLNYVDMFDSDAFWHSFNRSAVFVIGSVILGTVLGLFFAFALYRVVQRLRFLRALTVAPYIISNVAAAVMFRILFNGQFGLLNQAIEFLTPFHAPSWLANPSLAMGVVIFTQVWTDLPLTILLLLGGLMTIDRAYLEAALVDGAGGWKRAWHITIPLLAPQLLISTVWLSYSTLTGLGVVLALTGGGPLKSTQTMAMEMYTTAFRRLEFNQALAIATFILVLNAILTLGYVGIGRRYQYES